MHKFIFIALVFLGFISFGQKLETLPTPAASDSTGNPSDTAAQEKYLPAIPVAFDTLSYYEEYKRDVWQFKFGAYAGPSQGQFVIRENIVDQIGQTGLPVIGANGKIVKNSFINNPTFNLGYNGGVFLRMIRGSFMFQPEVVYSVKGGRFDILSNDGSLYKRVNGTITSVDVPLLVGIRFRDGRFLFGPSTNFAFGMNKNMKEALLDFKPREFLGNTFFDRPTLNINVGLGFQFGRFFFEARYEKGIRSYVIGNIGPDSSPKPFRLMADGLHFNIGLVGK